MLKKREVSTLKQLKIARTGYIIISILFYITGVILIGFPDIPGKWMVAAGGILLILYGAIKITGYLSRDLYCLAFQYDLGCGIFLIVLGIIILAVGQENLMHLPKGIGLLILLDSLLCVQTALDTRKFGLPAWKIILTASIAAGTCGVILSVTNSMTAAGFALLAEGFMRQYITQCTVRLMPCRREPDQDEEHTDH